jgi:hypothetical protein
MELISRLIISVLSKLFADEFKSWSPRLVTALIGSAVSRLPKEKQERYQEEWLSHLEEVPGEISKIVSALSFQIASLRIELACLKFKRAELRHAQAQHSLKSRARMTGDEMFTLGLLPEEKLDWRKFALSYGLVLSIVFFFLITR